MAKFRLTMIVDGVERTKFVEINDLELKSFLRLPPEREEMYRRNVIEKHLKRWALSNLTLSYEEVTDNGKGNSNRIDTAAEQ